MFSDVVTVFNRYKSRLGDMWYPTVIHGVNLNIDKASIVSKYGADSKDSAMLSIHYQIDVEKILVEEKEYLTPKEWSRQESDKFPDTITFASGTDFDVFMEGDYGSTEPIADDDYTDGFYNHMNRQHDYVFAITSVAKYSVIPTFQIMGA